MIPETASYGCHGWDDDEATRHETRQVCEPIRSIRGTDDCAWALEYDVIGLSGGFRWELIIEHSHMGFGLAAGSCLEHAPFLPPDTSRKRRVCNWPVAALSSDAIGPLQPAWVLTAYASRPAFSEPLSGKSQFLSVACPRVFFGCRILNGL